MIIPNMGSIPTNRSALGEALFSSVQRRVLALLLGHPDRSYQSAEVIRLVRGGTGGVHRELRRLERAGWLTVERIGNQKHYRAWRACPGFQELHALVLKVLEVDPPTGRPERTSLPGTPGRKSAGMGRQAPAWAAGPEPPAGEDPSPAAPAPAPSPDNGWKVW